MQAFILAILIVIFTIILGRLVIIGHVKIKKHQKIK